MLEPVSKHEILSDSDYPLLSDSPPYQIKSHRYLTDVISISSDDDLPSLDLTKHYIPKTDPLESAINSDPSQICNKPAHAQTHAAAQPPPPPPPPRDCIVIIDSDSDANDDQRPAVGDVYANLDAAKLAIYTWQELNGHKWRVAQSKKSVDGGPRKKIMLRCDHYYTYRPKHDLTIDPSDHRQGRTIKTDCDARVNLSRIPNTDQYTLSYANFTHNHERSIPEGGRAARPPTDAERATVKQFTQSGNFQRHQIKAIVQEQFPDTKLEDRQYSNLMNESRREYAAEINRMGGDIASVLTRLQDENARGAGYIYHTQFNSRNELTAIWWQSRRQQQLARRFGDVLLNDDAYNRNQYQFPLDVGIVIDNFGFTRNIFYAVHQFETIADHEWVLRHHLDSAQRSPEVFASDRHPSLIAAVSNVLPEAYHIYCLHHLHDNITSHLRSTLRADWDNFLRDFWKVYRALSPEAFDTLWNDLIQTYPAAREYLNSQLYPCRSRWAYCWIMSIFTAGVRTNGRCENENRNNKKVTGPKRTLLHLFERMNERTDQQQERELIAVRNVCISV